MPQQAGEQVQELGPRWGESVDPVPDLNQLQQRRVLRSLSVRVVQLQDQVLDGVGVKVHAVAVHLDAVDLHVAKVASRLQEVQGLVVDRAIPTGRRCLDPAPQVKVHRLEKGLPLVPQC